MLFRFFLATLILCIGFTANAQQDQMRAIENKGQWNSQVKYRLPIPGGKMYLEEDGFTYNFISAEDLEHLHHHSDALSTDIMHYHAVKLEFIGRNQAVQVKGEMAFPTAYNFLLGNDPEKWITKASAYNAVRYHDLYEGVDLYLYQQGDNLKYDLYVAPYADLDDIKMQYEGADTLYLEDGMLHIVTSVNEIVEMSPVAYQLINGEKHMITCAFEFATNGEIQFSFPGGYDRSHELVIDPVLIFSTYAGSGSDNWGYTATYDSLGNGYAGGISLGANYPASIGAYQQVYAGGGRDVAISKYSPDGTTLLYATYLGGGSDDNPMSMIVNSNHQLVVLGSTRSNNFPVTANAFDNTQSGGSNTTDLFITVLSEDGSVALGSTYIGGGGNDGYNTDGRYMYGDEFRSEVVVDDQNNIYVTSNTSSFNFPVTAGAFDETYNGGQDACIFKMNANASNLIWSTFLGGSGIDAGYGIVVDRQYDVYVCGGTAGGLPVSVGALHPTFQGGTNQNNNSFITFSADGFVSRISADGSAIKALTYIQANNTAFDEVFFLELDEEKNVYVLGNTEGTFPITSGLYANPGSPMFIQKLDSSLSTLQWSTVFGSGTPQGMISPSAFLVDNCNRIYVSGWSGSTMRLGSNSLNFGTQGLPTTPGAIQTTTSGSDSI